MKSFSSKTKGNYLHSSNERNLKKPLIWILCAFLVLFIGVQLVRWVASTVLIPFYAFREYIHESSGTVPVFFRSRIELERELESLRSENAILMNSDTHARYLEEQNEALKSMCTPQEEARILAGVISRPPYTPYDTLIIDRGEAEGVIESAPVYYGEEKALGYVRTVFAHTALVTLFSSPGAHASVYLFGPDVFASAYGEGGGIVRISIPQGIQVEEGNLAILPALPGGILGKVHTVRSVPTEPEQHAYVALDIPLQSIRLVSVGKIPVRPIVFEEAVAVVGDERAKLFTFSIPEIQSTTTLPVNELSTTTP